MTRLGSAWSRAFFVMRMTYGSRESRCLRRRSEQWSTATRSDHLGVDAAIARSVQAMSRTDRCDTAPSGGAAACASSYRNQYDEDRCGIVHQATDVDGGDR
jgi:hypothetical protein